MKSTSLLTRKPVINQGMAYTGCQNHNQGLNSFTTKRQITKRNAFGSMASTIERGQGTYYSQL